MREYFTISTHTGYHIIHNRMQGRREPFEDFAMELERLDSAVSGELPTATYNSVIVQRIIDGIRGTGYQVTIISSNPRSLTDALDMACRIEAKCRRRHAAAMKVSGAAQHQEIELAAPQNAPTIRRLTSCQSSSTVHLEATRAGPPSEEAKGVHLQLTQDPTSGEIAYGPPPVPKDTGSIRRETTATACRRRETKLTPCEHSFGWIVC